MIEKKQNIYTKEFARFLESVFNHVSHLYLIPLIKLDTTNRIQQQIVLLEIFDILQNLKHENIF